MRKGVWIALIVALVLGFWATGRADPMLVKVGLNSGDCVQNGFGATFCGDAAKRYQAGIAQAQADAAVAQAEAQAEMEEAEAAAEAAQAELQAEMDEAEAEAQAQTDLEAEWEAYTQTPEYQEEMSR